MASRSNGEPIAWEQVLVRHVVAARREDVGRLSSLVQAPFPSNCTATYDNCRDLAHLRPAASGRWLLAARFAKNSWVPLFSNAATAKAIFDANAHSRRLEVAWVGCQPEGAGWFAWVHRAGKPIAQFAQAIDVGRTGEQAFRRVCASLEISLPLRVIRSTEQGFVVIGARGTPVKSALRGCIVIDGPAISAGENAGADALAEAIEACDARGIRRAIEHGAPLTVLPDHSMSPLLSALFRYGRCTPKRWESCLDVLLASGCPIDGTPPDDPPILDCVQPFIPEANALEMVKFLVARGANVNATDVHGTTALFESVVHRRVKLVQFLSQHGADARLRTGREPSTIEWLEQRLRKRFGSPEEAEYAGIRDLLLGSSSTE